MELRAGPDISWVMGQEVVSCKGKKKKTKRTGNAVAWRLSATRVWFLNTILR